ncbi:MAG: twin-arginine translocation signal domain-containing protein [Planctomycetota bacterium]|jgi:hypothetical protein
MARDAMHSEESGKKQLPSRPASTPEAEAKRLSRRRFVGRSLGISAAGALAGLSLEERVLLAGPSEEGSAIRPASGELPGGRIGKLQVSRLICGGNLFSGFAHSRDLIYVSRWMKEYFTPEKIMDTLQACEENGVNAAVLRCDDHIRGVLDRYRKERGGKMQWIAQTYPKADNLTENVQMAIDGGAVGAFMQGGIGDRWVADGRVDLVEKYLDFVKQNNLAAGVGSHSLDVPKTVEKESIEPDFYFKTFNNVDYNCEDPQATLEFFKTVKKPWIAFKVLGAGVTKPREGFALALRSGADFLNVGMLDFQVREDVTILNDLLASNLPRERPWVA